MENVHLRVAELLNYFKKPASPSASSEAAYDIMHMLENPLFPSSIEQLKQFVKALKGVQDFALARNLLNVALQVQVPESCYSIRTTPAATDWANCMSRALRLVRDGHAEGVPRTMPELSIQPVGESDQQSFNPEDFQLATPGQSPRAPAQQHVPEFWPNRQFTRSLDGRTAGPCWRRNRCQRALPPRLLINRAPTEDLKKYRLGHAVAASACVPGLFEPISIDGLF